MQQPRPPHPHRTEVYVRTPRFLLVAPAGGAMIALCSGLAAAWKLSAERGELPGWFWMAAAGCAVWMAIWLINSRRLLGPPVALAAAVLGWNFGRTEPPVPGVATYYQQRPTASGYAPQGYPASGWTPAPSYQQPYQPGPAPSHGGPYGY